MKPAISVVVPVWNEEQSVNTCIRSLLAQRTETPYEIIIVDNNSTDKSYAIASKFENVRVISEKRQGRAYARNRGLTYARGDIIALTEADCVVPNDWIERIHTYFVTHPNYIGIAGASMLYHAPIIQICTHIIILFSSFMYRLYSGNNTLRGQNCAFRKHILPTIGDFHIDAAPFDDLDFGFRAGKLGPIAYIPSLVIETSDRRIQGRLLRSFIEYWSTIIRLFILKHEGNDEWYPSIRHN